VVTDLAHDPTLPRSLEHPCPKCHLSNAIYFQASSADDSGMELFFVCQQPDCGYRWKSTGGADGA
jgi:DNA-directed RNA polymerase II subunit RPB9